jgi:cytoskeleton protein RodZ
LPKEQAESFPPAPQIHQHDDAPIAGNPSSGIEPPPSVESQPSEIFPQVIVKNETEPDQAPGDPETRRPVGRTAWEVLVGFFRRSKSRAVDSPSDTKDTEGPGIEAEPISPVISNAKDFNPRPVVAEPAAAISSEEIFKEIGGQLRKRRELLSLTQDEIERQTRVRTVFLEALENGALDELPSPVQTRGILANYATFLDLDADTILLRFADGLQARYRESLPDKPSRTRAPMAVHTKLPPLRTFIASDLLFGGGVAIMLLLFAIWGIGRVMTVRSTTIPQATSPSISDVLAGTGLPTPPQEVTLIPAENTSQASTPEVTETFVLATLGADVNVQINLVSIEQTFMRVVVDGQVEFEGRTQPDKDYSYEAKDQIEVLVGNAAGLKVTYNGRDLGLMGNFGEVIDRVYTAEGVVTPTSTPAPTSTATPNVTGTPTETLTPTPSVTPTPKSGE